MKISMKRLGALIMALVMVFGLLPVMNNTANAVDVSGLTDGTIGVSYTLANNPGANAGVTAPTGNSLIIVGSGKLVGSNYMSCVNTVTITNNKTTKATLSFDFALSGTFGTVEIDGTSYTAATSSSYSKELEAGKSITIKVTPKRTNKASGGNELTVAITSLALVAAGVGPITATFEAPAYGSYTVAYGDTTLTVAAGTASQEATNEASVAYTLTVTPDQGYKLVGWYDSVSGNYLSTDASFVAYFDKAATVRPIIVPENTAVFLVGTNYYSDLNEAVEYAQNNALTQITLVQSGILEDNGENYVIPAGITLLIPMDKEYTATGFDEFGPAPEFTTEVVAPYAYLTLTLGEGVVLEINGILDIESKHTTAQGSGGARPYGGRPSGAYGAIYMSPETNITVNDGGSVYAWGYIYGQGTVDAASGAQVYELMQVLDFPGGSNMSGFVDSDPAYDFDGDTNPTNDYIKTFPFSQYYVQNIEVELNLYAGATEYVYIAMSAASVSMGMPVQFIGKNGMFFAENGVITKKYDPSTDRLEVTVDGDASMSGITLDMTGTEYESAMLQFLGVSKVDSATFILTLNSNITIDIVSGTTTVKQDLALLPGVEVYVREGASMVIAQREFADGEYDNLTVYGTGGYNVYLWDLENWGKYVFANQYLMPLSYSPTSGRYTRSYSDLKDVVLCIDGTVIVEGFIYSTVTFDEDAWMPISGGASVISNGTGKLVLTNGCGIEDLAYCLDGSSGCDHNMFVDSVWLQNGDGSYLKTECGFCNFTDETLEDCQNYGTEYYYCDVHECWYTSGHGNCTAAVEITWVINGQGQTMEVTVGEVPAYPITPSKPQSGCTVYTFAGWATSINGQVLAQLPEATVDAVYYAIFTESISHEGDNDENHFCDGCGDGPSDCVDADEDHNCDFAGCGEGLTDCVDADKDHYCDYAGCGSRLSNCKDNDADHYCDLSGCGQKLSSCVDGNKDHYCDYSGCNAKLSSCVDSNNDHRCDYAGCNAIMSSCKDANNDHRCDYAGCRKTLSSCVDVNDDHYCDYTGCNEQMTSCEDIDEDHYCDYAGCCEELTECEDSDEDHYCDYVGCEYQMTDCVDTDGDHYCDFSGCGYKMNGCVDQNQDHICDFEGCGIKVSQCADRDQNHYCDYAGCHAAMSSCVDVNQDHKCDYTGCRATLSSCADGNKDHHCDYSGCKKELSNCTDGNKDHYCDYSGCKDKLSNCTDGNYDHYCDYSGCNDKLSDCEDSDDNHYCDIGGCGAELTSCVDADEDHFCDYAGCGAELTTCVDANEDHHCDFDGCGAGMSICVDSDEDHYCDYAGCGEKTSSCYDKNNDHYCDYAKCGEKLSNCKDDNQDHKCDYAGCGATLSSCEDVNKDHKCDFTGCKAILSNCEDNDEDHRCDYSGCKAIMSACEDSDEDHYCDYAKCGKQLTDCCDDDGNHYCDYAGCGAKLSDCTPGETWEDVLTEAGCENGEKLVVTYCAICGEEYSEEYEPIPALGHGHSEGWDYIQIDNDVHKVWCADCWSYTYDEGHNYVSHVCEDCGWIEMMSVKFYNGDALWRETSAPYGGSLGIAGMPIPAAPTGYQFAGWYTENDVKVVHGMTVTENMVAYATWSKQVFEITWIVDGITTVEPYEYGATPSFKGNTDKAADGCTAYTFIGWDKTLVTVTGDMTYTAQYESGISHVGEVKYTNNGNGTHNGAYDCCGTAYVTNEAHKYINGVCACGALEHVCADNLTAHEAVTPDCCNGGNTAYYSCSCGKFYSDANASNEIAKDSWILGKDSSNHIGTVGYTNNGADHTAAYSCCGASWNENHTYVDGTCVCDALKVSKLTVVYGASGEYKIELMVPYGTRLFDVVDFDVVSANMYVHSADRWGYYEQSSFYGCYDNSGNLGYLYYFGENYIMPDCDFYIEARYEYNGFIHDGIGWQYIRGEHLYKDVLIGVMMGDLYEGGSFEEFEGLYAFDENGYRIENGLFRDYYIGEWINGVTYAPNAEDIAYYESKGMTFIDAEQTWYYFGADGKWAYNYTGRFGNSYIVNGHAAWHVGLVEIEGDYYYFKGDEVNGGNIMVTGDYYISRNNTEKDVVIGGLYTFGADGKLCWNNGITEVNGVLRYYEDGCLMMGKGLTQVGENFIYVNSYGELIVDAEYYVGVNALGIKKGIYDFDAEGFMVIPEEEPGKSGLFFEGEKWYYYVDGAKAYCAGLIEIDGNWVYVKSDGSLATGVYYVTNTNGHATIASGTKCTFDENGVLIDPVIFIKVLDKGSATVDAFDWETDYVFAFTPDKDGKLTIEVSNIVLDGEYENVGFCVDVLTTCKDWLGENFVLDGYMEYNVSADMGECFVFIYPAYETEDYCDFVSGSFDYKISLSNDGSPKNGIVDGYYYVDGHIAYAAGLIEIDGYYYYVRSNGQIVTDCQYWITNVNDTGYEPGLYMFDVDGCMSEIYVDTFTGIKDGYFYMDDEIAYNAGLKQYNGGYIYVRSNGQIATGKYWITNHNGLLPEGFYDFGEDGFYYPPVPENAYLVKDVVKNTETDGFYDYLGTAEGILPQADGMLYIEVTDITYAEEILNAAGFDVYVDSSDYWAREFGASVVGTATIMMPVTAGNFYALFVNPADIDGEDYSVINGTISYKIWSTVECELQEVSVGE